MKNVFSLGSALVLVLLVSGTSYAQRNSGVIKGGPHDLSAGSAVTSNDPSGNIQGQTCIYCHAPHGGSNTNPLWNRSAPTTTYSLYTSTTMTAPLPGQGSTPGTNTIQNSLSGACLSCHDGNIAMDVLINVNGVASTHQATFTTVAKTATTGANATYSNGQMTGGLPFLGSDLRNDHPVAIVYDKAYSDASKVGQYNQVSSPTSGQFVVAGPYAQNLPLFGPASGAAAASNNVTVECASCHMSHDNTNLNFLRKPNDGSKMCLTCHKK